ncbi:MAG: SpoIIE family protein phosphatase [Hyphomicrobium sp.]|nr:SpoIIE family protein phosphatase [Hyphomicrobium sp.]
MSAAVAPRLTWRRPWYGVPLGIALAILLAGLRWYDPTPVERVRLLQFDLFHKAVPRTPGEVTVWIVDVDDFSLRELGQWPWPRWRLASLVEVLQNAGIAALGVDMVFDQPDRLSPPLYAQQAERLPSEVRDRLATLPSTDQRLSEVLGMGPVSMAALGSEDEEGASRPPRTSYRLRGGDPKRIGYFKSAVRSLPEMTLAASGEGLANATPEHDNIVRRVPVVAKVGEGYMPSLGLDTLRLATDSPSFSILSEAGRIQGVEGRNLAVRTTVDGRLWLYFSAHRPERFVSAADILAGRVDLKLLRGNIVLLGSTAFGLGDFHASPIDGRVPGVEMQAQAIENMAEGSYLTRWERPGLWEGGIVLAVGLLVVLLLPYRQPGRVGAALAVGAVILGGISFGLFYFGHILVDATTPVFGSLLLVGQMFVAQLRATDQERKRIASDLAREREMAARVEGELAAARQIQMGMLPQVFPEVRGFEIAARIEPAKAVGGDFYDVRLLDDGRVYFVIGDVSGKGVPAALFMALAQSLSRASARLSVDVGRMVTETNRELSAENPAMMFVTLVAGLLDPASGAVVFANAGHDAPIRIGPDGALDTLEGDGGPPLCVIDDCEYPFIETSLAPGQALVLFTDGVTEATAVDQALYGMERLHGILRRGGSSSAGDLVGAVVSDVGVFAQGAEPADDVTVLVIRRAVSAL